MFQQLALATLMVAGIVLAHLLGLAVLIRLLRSHTRFIRSVRVLPITVLLGATLGVIAIHTIEIWLYAALYLGLHCFADFEQALYFSTVTYASIGYGDVLMPHQWRILGAIEGAVGIVMLGWSTAFLVSLLAQLKLFGHDWLTPDERSRADGPRQRGTLIETTRIGRPEAQGNWQPGVIGAVKASGVR